MHANDFDPATSTGARLPDVLGLEELTEIARGGHATVYRALQRDHDRVVALKVLNTRSVDAAARRRFDRERVALGRLSDHPAVTSLFDSGYTEAGEPYLVLEYAPGGSLADYLEGGAMNVDDATDLVVCLSSAVQRAHDAGVIHCDIKPANIMLSAYGSWLLGDFGIASVSDTAQTSVVHATYAHAAPEIFGGEPLTPATDVYSLASVLATCLTGDEPFAPGYRDAAGFAMWRVASEPYPDLRARGVEHPLAAIMESALRKAPEQRPASARSFGAELNRFREWRGLGVVGFSNGPGWTVPLRAEPTVVVTGQVGGEVLSLASPRLDRGPALSPTLSRFPPRAATLGALAVAPALFVGAFLGVGVLEDAAASSGVAAGLEPSITSATASDADQSEADAVVDADPIVVDDVDTLLAVVANLDDDDNDNNNDNNDSNNDDKDDDDNGRSRRSDRNANS